MLSLHCATAVTVSPPLTRIVGAGNGFPIASVSTTLISSPLYVEYDTSYWTYSPPVISHPIKVNPVLRGVVVVKGTAVGMESLSVTDVSYTFPAPPLRS